MAMNQEEIQVVLLRLKADIEDVKGKLTQAGTHTKSLADQTKRSVSEIRKHWLGYTAAITAVVYPLAKAYGSFSRFEHKMLEVNTLIRASAKDLQQYKNRILALTREVPQSADELASAMYDVVSAGVSAGRALDVVGLSAKAAVAGVTDTKTAANAGLSVINAYGQNISELGNVYDTLFKTVEQGVITFPQISAAIGNVLPVASAAGVNFNEIAGSLAQLTKNGIDANSATTYLKSGILALSAPTSEAQELMQSLKIEWKDGWIATLQQLSGVLGRFTKDVDKIRFLRKIIPDMRAGQAIVALTNNIDGLNATMREMDTSAGSMQKAFKIMEDSPVNQVKKMKNAVDELAIGIGSKLAPAIQDLILGWSHLLNLNPDTQASKLIDRINQDRRALKATENTLAILGEQRSNSLKEEQERTEKILRFTRLKKKLEESIAKLQEQLEPFVPSVETVRKRMRGEEESTIKKVASGEPPPTLPGSGKGDDKAAEAALRASVARVAATFEIYSTQTRATLDQLTDDYAAHAIEIKEFYATKAQLLKNVAAEEIRTNTKLIELSKEESEKIQLRTKNQTIQIRVEQELSALRKEELKELDVLAQKRAQAAEKVQDIINRINSVGYHSFTDRMDLELQALRDKHAEEIRILEQHEATKDQIVQVHAAQRAEMDRTVQQQKLEYAQHSADVLSSIATQINDIYAEYYNYVVEQEQRKMNAAIESARAAGASEEQLASKRASLQTQMDARVKKAWEKQKRAQIAMAVINAAQAIIKGYSDYGPILGSVFAALTAVATGIQIARISSQEYPGMAEGGLIAQGTTGTADDVHARVSRGEFVQPKASVDYYGPGVYEAMRRRQIPREMFAGIGNFSVRKPSSMTFAEGGLVPSTASAGATNQQTGVNIVNFIDPSLMDRYLGTMQGQRAILNTISNRSYEVRKAIGV